MDTVEKQRSRWAVGAHFFLHGLCFSSWSARIPAIQQHLGLSEALLGTILFAMPVGSILSMPIASHLTHRFGSRKVLVGGLAIYVALLVSLGLAENAYQLAAALFAFGGLSNLVNVSVNTQAVGVEGLYGRAVMSGFHGLWSLAGFTAAVIGTFMIARHVTPFSHFVYILAFILLSLGIVSRFLLRDSKKMQSKAKLFEMPDRNLLFLGLVAMCSMICEGAMFDWSGIYFQSVVRADPAYVGLGYTSFMSSMAGTRFIADRLKMRWGAQRLLRFCGILIALGFLIAAAFPTLWVSALAFLLIGAGTSAVVPLVYSEAGKSSARSVSASIAAVSTVGFFGFLAGPPVIGWIAGITSLRISFLLLCFMGSGVLFFSRFLNSASSQLKN